MNKIDLLIMDWHKPFWDVDNERRYYDMTYSWYDYTKSNYTWIVAQDYLNSMKK